MTVTQPATWPQDHWADVGGRRLRYWDVGVGSPAIVIDGGLGTCVADWVQLLPHLSANARTICYDRAGLGASDPDPGPRTAGAMVADLRAVLAAAGAEPPYVLVGHSWGGTVVRLFALQHADQVAGLVLVDPTHEATVTPRTMRMNAISYAVMVGLATVRVLPLLLRGSATMRGYSPEQLAYVLSDVPRTARAARREAAGIGASLVELEQAAARSPGVEYPVVVLSAGGSRRRRGPVAKVYERLHALHMALAAGSPDGRHQLVEGAGHYVHLDRPDVVSAAVADVLAAARRRRV